MVCSVPLLLYLHVRLGSIGSIGNIDDAIRLEHSTLLSLWAVLLATLSYIISFGVVWTFGRGVSHPGGPREHKIRRMPKWDDVTTTIDQGLLSSSSSSPWRCAVAKDSHISTLKRFGLDPKTHGENGVLSDKVVGLCGEPFGRQMWTTEVREKCSNVDVGLDVNTTDSVVKENNSAYGSIIENNSGNDTDTDSDSWTNIAPSMDTTASASEPAAAATTTKKLENNTDLIRQMALADRKEYGFNPSKNPNSADLIFREQMITNYVAKGGTLPDVSEKCKTVEEAMKKAVHFYSMLQTEDGHWAGDYGGPHFLMPGMIITW